MSRRGGPSEPPPLVGAQRRVRVAGSSVPRLGVVSNHGKRVGVAPTSSHIRWPVHIHVDRRQGVYSNHLRNLGRRYRRPCTHSKLPHFPRKGLLIKDTTTAAIDLVHISGGLANVILGWVITEIRWSATKAPIFASEWSYPHSAMGSPQAVMQLTEFQVCSWQKPKLNASLHVFGSSLRVQEPP